MTICSIVDSAPVGTAAHQVVESRNPSNQDELVATAELAGADVLVAACATAHQRAAGWGAVPAPVRAQLLLRFRQLVAANAEALAVLMTREIGKPLRESHGEIQEILDTCDFFVGEGRRLYGQTVPSEMRDKQLMTFRRPVGTVVIITAANFPVAVPSWYLIPALLCGNTVVWKPSEFAPATSDALYRLLRAAGAGAELGIVHADGAQTAAGLSAALEAGLVQRVGFTGSTAVGRQISEICGRHLQVPCLELGGKNPMVVMPDADLDDAVSGAVFSGFATAGQRCTSLGVVAVHEDIHQDFLSAFARATETATIGDPVQDVLYGPLIAPPYLERFAGWLDLIQPHHKVYGSTGIGRITADNPRHGFLGAADRGLFVHPTIVDGVRPDDALYQQETFGPIVGVATFATFDEAVALANGHGYGLSAAIYTGDATTAFRFRERCSAGMISINNSTVGAEAHLPFGGNGRSGNGGRLSGVWVLDQFTTWQAVNWDYSGRLQRAQLEVEALPPSDLDFRL